MSKPQPSPESQHLPFKFSGGFGWSTQTNGAFLAVQGALQMVAQLILFPFLSKRFGSLRTFWITLSLYPILYLLVSYPSLAIILANSSPSKRVLGTLNGAAASSASICRGFGPTISGAIDSLGGQLGMSGLAWWAIAGVALLGWAPGFMLKEPMKMSAQDEETLVDSESDTESIMTLTPDEDAEMILSK
jgi:hypothetical protein